MKRLITLCLSATLILTLNSCKNNTQHQATIASNDNVVVTLFTYDGKGETRNGIASLGHAFIMLTNISSSNVTFLNKTIEPSKNLMVGTWSISAHFGVWYNLESNYSVFNNKYDGRYSVSIGITNDELSKLETFTSTHDKWNCLYNCSKFALNFYDEVANEQEYIKKPLIYTPSYIAGEIKKFDHYEVNKPMITDEGFGYYVDNEYHEYSFNEDFFND